MSNMHDVVCRDQQGLCWTNDEGSSNLAGACDALQHGLANNAHMWLEGHGQCLRTASYHPPRSSPLACTPPEVTTQLPLLACLMQTSMRCPFQCPPWPTAGQHCSTCQTQAARWTV